MRILVLTFYYHPDLSAGSFRITPLVEALRQLAPPDAHIDVITTTPNRYRSFAVDAPLAETRAGLSVFRVPVGTHQSGMADQSRAFLAFARGAAAQAAKQQYDVVFASSGRLMTAVLASYIARRQRAPLFLDIRDIFVDGIGEVLPRAISWAAKRFFSRVERWAFGRANRINLISRGFLPYFAARYPGRAFTFYTNGVDEEFAAASLTTRQAGGDAAASRRLRVLYAGNVGEAQGLHTIVPPLAARMRDRIKFTIIGDGGRRVALEAAVAEAGLDNVRLVAPMNRRELLAKYAEADVLFLHLNDYEAFTTVLPSKLFEYAALGKPIWAGVAGYPACFIRSEITNAAVFHPCDVGQAIAAFGELEIRDARRTGFLATYSRPAISRAMAADILGLANRGGGPRRGDDGCD